MYRTVFGVVPMDTGHSTPGPALLQSPSVGHIPPETIQDSDGAVTQPLPVSWSSRHPGSKARQLYDAEWENLQPLLHILYIKEIRTLAATRKALRERYGFNLSKKQLTKRFAHWKFKKNVKQHETGTFLSKSGPLLGEAECSVDGVRITAAKRERWKKRSRMLDNEENIRTMGVISTTDMPSNVTGQTPFAFTPSMASPSTLRREDSSGMSVVSPSTLLADQAEAFTYHDSAEDPLPLSLAIPADKATISDVSPSTLVINAFGPVGALSSAHVSLGTVGESEFNLTWPIPLESPDNDTETLTRLFSALNMDYEDISLCNLPAQAAAEEATPTMDTVSLEDLEAGGFDGQLVPWAGKHAAICETACLGSNKTVSHRSKETPQQGTIMLVSHQYGSGKRTTTGAFKYSFVDVIFSSSEVVEPDRFSLEVYPFPRDQGRRLEAQPISKSSNVLFNEMNECILKINKLENATLGSNNAVTTLKERLAIAYFGLGHFDKAEHQFKRILPELEQSHGQHSHHVISVKRDLAEAILYLGKFQEANQIAQDVYTFARRSNPGGVLYQEATFILALSFGYLSNLMREEELLRELVQIRLNAFGPKHGDTLVAIGRLCNSMMVAKKDSESEELMRVALELSPNATDLSSLGKYIICREFDRILYFQGKYADSEALLKKTVEMSEKLLGIEHQDTFRCKFRLCQVLRARGLLLESHDILLESIEMQMKTRTQLRGNIIACMAFLSILMIDMRKMDGAYQWMERALRYTVALGGMKSVRASQFFEDLSSFNEPEQQQELITALYKRTTEDITHSAPVRLNISWTLPEHRKTKSNEEKNRMK